MSNHKTKTSTPSPLENSGAGSEEGQPVQTNSEPAGPMERKEAGRGKTGPKIQDLTGRRFGRLEVLRYERSKVNGRWSWVCRCDCGSEKLILSCNLRNGSARSCGCLQRECASIRQSTHRMTHTPEFYIWRSMKQRCENPKRKDYKNYGGRGIGVCLRWMVSFETFYEDMGPRPSPTHQIDRTNNSEGYSPSNCKWVTPSQNSKNRRKRKYDAGKTKSKS